MVLALASLGLPGMVNFVAEFLVLFGAFHVSVALAAWASVGLVLSAGYSLWMVQNVFHGTKRTGQTMTDLSPGEMTLFAVFMGLIFWMGMNPQPVLKTAAPALTALQKLAAVPDGPR